jgi:hypothetical protein
LDKGIVRCLFQFFFECFCISKHKGLYAREKLQWREATDAFFVAQTVFAKLAQVGDAEQRAVAQTRAENIEPLVAYCAYRLGGAADRSTMDKALLGKLDA